MRYELIADLRRSRTYALEAKVTHLSNSSLEAPSALSNISTFAVLEHHTKELGQLPGPLAKNTETPCDEPRNLALHFVVGR